MTPEQFVEALQSRGIELSVKNNRLKLDPGVAWKELTSEEVLCLKSHRGAIKRLADGSEPAPKVEPGAKPSKPTTPEPEPEPMVWTRDYSRRITRQDLHDTRVTGTNRAAYELARERLEKQAEKERDVRATNTMIVSLLRHQRGTHGGYR